MKNYFTKNYRTYSNCLFCICSEISQRTDMQKFLCSVSYYKDQMRHKPNDNAI